ncbi:DUF1735 domain-containing protein [Rufibacter immobilis]|uniref:DUF1735 domain-containing protein n=1 Tax=Rufibacter immobilis TaxID=1348778 RepID=UPI0035E7F3BB
MKKILNLFLVFIAVTSLSSCLDEDPVFDGEKSQHVVEIQYAGSNYGTFPTVNAPFPLTAISFDIVAGKVEEVPVYINYAGGNVAPEDITVTIAVNQSALTIFNDSTRRNYSLLPENAYSIPSMTVTIPAGQRTAVFPIRVRPEFLNPALQQALAITITNVSTGTISGNFKTAILEVSAKNMYDGIYSSVAGNVQRYSAPGVPTVNDALNGSMAGNADVTLRTTGANTVEITGLRWHGNASGIAGIDNLRATIDPVTNEVTMTALGNTTLRNIPSTVNTYDPDTKTFTLNFEWNPTSTRRAITGLVLRYSKSR